MQKQVIDDFESISANRIVMEPNSEVRRVMIERFGLARFLAESGAVEEHRDECGTLYRKELFQDEPIVMVKVKNSTVEPDGTFRDYFIRVPPHIHTARAGVAWTFDMSPEEYRPDFQS